VAVVTAGRGGGGGGGGGMALQLQLLTAKDKIFKNELKARGCYKKRNSCSREPK
jgi:hypothetical protein